MCNKLVIWFAILLWFEYKIAKYLNGMYWILTFLIKNLEENVVFFFPKNGVSYVILSKIAVKLVFLVLK